MAAPEATREVTIVAAAKAAAPLLSAAAVASTILNQSPN